ncbi:MAG: 50S ribosomal protein L10 [candidate division WOR-3 bacterium]
MRKEQVIERVKELLKDAKGIYFVDYQGIKTGDLNTIRKKLRESAISFSVVKNRLAAIALQEFGILDKALPFLKGPTSILVSRNDEIAPARLLKDFQKNYPFKFKGAIIEKEVFAANQFDLLASIPSRQELLSHLFSSLLSPIAQLIALLEGLLNDLIATLTEMEKKGH